ncbi:MarR family winged helix-turn-helix transcriptional regulator [Ruegeria sp.]|uniref:MarR family winged helix-turn-helix transcriptional regulator n=1 Tax=Ruegeria sp. TaxID=1879320 RepID=UPI0023202B27|nr:MarR family winged helix-turn-helix transcriptional regulator [Ruegeria sp.]MDA7965921.1 MarR family winged helix-turn-helix transcriptional regulator [Ruegeria sp.]
MTQDISELPDDMFLVDTDEGGTTLSFSRSPTVLLTFAANRFTRNAAKYYQDRFGIGAMDWRMLVMLTRSPGCSVALASKTIGIDKAAVSRSLARLEASGLAEASCASSDERRKSWRLTENGRVLHDRILGVALARQKKLLNGFSPQDVEQFTAMLGAFLNNLETLREDGE